MELIKDRLVELGADKDRFCDPLYKKEYINCELTFVNPRQVIQFCTIIRNSRLTMSKQAINQWWTNVYFASCKFHGRYIDCLFGLDDPVDGICTIKPEMIDCDFSEAHLHMCTFLNCKPEEIRFPKWPFFTVLHPRQNAEDWSAIPFPDEFTSRKEIIAMKHPTIVASVNHWPSFAEEDKITTSEEEIRKLMIGKPYILL